jgi:hypothetical protein
VGGYIKQPLPAENERLVGRLQQLFGHIEDVQVKIAAAGNKLLELQSQLEEDMADLHGASKVPSVDLLLQGTTANLDDTDKRKFHAVYIFFNSRQGGSINTIRSLRSQMATSTCLT